MSYSEVKTTINSTLGNENFQPLDQIVVSNIQQVLNKLDTSSSSGNQVVKSVQRGVQAEDTSIYYDTEFINYNFPLNTVNPNKCMVHINSIHYESFFRTMDETNYTSFSLAYGHALISLSSNQLQVSCRTMLMNEDDRFTPAFTWEVIEFY